MAEPAPDELTLDELAVALAPLVAEGAPFDGWGREGIAAAALVLGVPADRAALAFPGGAIDVIDRWFASVDAAMLAACPAEELAALRVHQRIRALLLARFAVLAPHREALRRALAVLAQPQHAPRAARLGWRAADRMWRAAGDAAVDLNHYSKRAILAAIYGATALIFLDDKDPELADTRAFLDRRLGDVARFERWKAGRRAAPDRHFSLTRFLGRLRYPAR